MQTPMREGMATHSRIPAWRLPMDRGAWWATVPGVAESDTTEATYHTGMGVYADTFQTTEGIPGLPRPFSR